jgi:predicted alpha/beta superfamily hydrolase
MRTFIILFLCTSSLAVKSQTALPKVSSGFLQRHQLAYIDTTSGKVLDVWLPESYDPKNRYAVLYFQDGQMLFDSSTTWNKQEWKADETISKMMDEGAIAPCIVVGIWNAGKNRHAEYFPQKAFEMLNTSVQDSIYQANRPNGNSVFNDTIIFSDHYLSFLVSTIKPYIDSTYSTFADRQHTFVAGSSMGGLISLYALCEYPDIFGGAACLSTHWPGLFYTDNNPIPETFLRYLESHLPDPESHKLYFDRGTATLDEWYGPYQEQADQIVRSKGYTEYNFKTLIFVGDEHSEKAWSSRLAIPIQFLLGSR